MGNYYETFDPPFVLTRVGPTLPDNQRAYAFDEDTRAADEALEAAIWKRLAVLAGAVDLARIELSVERGFVTLRSRLEEAAATATVERFVDNTIGVRGVVRASNP